jgi:hypothetical protein
LRPVENGVAQGTGKKAGDCDQDDGQAIHVGSRRVGIVIV